MLRRSVAVGCASIATNSRRTLFLSKHVFDGSRVAIVVQLTCVDDMSEAITVTVKPSRLYVQTPHGQHRLDGEFACALRILEELSRQLDCQVFRRVCASRRSAGKRLSALGARRWKVLVVFRPG